MLSALLNDHPDIHASTNSPLLDLIHDTEGYLFNRSEQYKAHPKPESARKILTSLAENYYFDTPEPVIVDKSRGWVNQIGHISDYITDTPKIICPVRDIADILVSFIALLEAGNSRNYIDEQIRKKGVQPTNDARCYYLMSSIGTVGHAYLTLRDAFRRGFDRHLLLVEYEDLVANTQTQMDRIYEFIGVSPHVHDTQNVRVQFEEDDSVYGLPGMHSVRPAIAKLTRDRNRYLSQEIQKRCQGLEFWRSR